MNSLVHYRNSKTFWVLLRIIFGALFVFSGLMKFIDLHAFEIALGKFKLLDESTLPIVKFLVPMIEIILGVVVLFALFTGFKQISTKNDVFSQAMLYCCNAGYCHDVPCSTACSISRETNSVCHDYISNCDVCIEMIPTLLLQPDCNYSGPIPSWCN